MSEPYDWLDDGAHTPPPTMRQVDPDHLLGIIDAYFEELERSMEHDRQFQLNATWGILSGTVSLSAIAAVYFVTSCLNLNPWIEGAIGTAVFLVVLVWMHGYVEKGKEGDRKKLSRLPKWATYSERLPRRWS